MRGRGPGQWREWRMANMPVVPLYDLPDSPVLGKGKRPTTKEDNPEHRPKTLNEIAYLTTRALVAKSSLPKLTESITEMVQREASPCHGRVQEDSLREAFKQTALAHLSTEEFLNIWPPPPPESRTGSKAGSRTSSKRSTVHRKAGNVSSRPTNEVSEEGQAKSPDAG